MFQKIKISLKMSEYESPEDIHSNVTTLLEGFRKALSSNVTGKHALRWTAGTLNVTTSIAG
jgi:hypothetical protein